MDDAHTGRVLTENGITTGCNNMEELSVSMALYEGKAPVTGGFPSQSASNVEHSCVFGCWQTFEQTTYVPAI